MEFTNPKRTKTENLPTIEVSDLEQSFVDNCIHANANELQELYNLLLDNAFDLTLNGTYIPVAPEQRDSIWRMVYGNPTLVSVCDYLRKYFNTHRELLQGEYISRLPPELIAGILSHLPKRTAVRASRVSKQFQSGYKYLSIRDIRLFKEFLLSYLYQITERNTYKYPPSVHLYGSYNDLNDVSHDYEIYTDRKKFYIYISYLSSAPDQELEPYRIQSIENAPKWVRRLGVTGSMYEVPFETAVEFLPVSDIKFSRKEGPNTPSMMKFFGPLYHPVPISRFIGQMETDPEFADEVNKTIEFTLKEMSNQ